MDLVGEVNIAESATFLDRKSLTEHPIDQGAPLVMVMDYAGVVEWNAVWCSVVWCGVVWCSVV